MANSSRKANTLPAANTAPVRLIQFRSSQGRLGGVGFSSGCIGRIIQGVTFFFARWPESKKLLLRLLQRTSVRHQGLDIVVAEFVAERLHCFLTRFVGHAFLDGLDGVRISEGGLEFGIGQILDVQLASHLRLSLAVLPVTGGALRVPNLVDVPGPGGPSKQATQ